MVLKILEKEEIIKMTEELKNTQKNKEYGKIIINLEKSDKVKLEEYARSLGLQLGPFIRMKMLEFIKREKQ